MQSKVNIVTLRCDIEGSTNHTYKRIFRSAEYYNVNIYV
jgi:hypothetical protein